MSAASRVSFPRELGAEVFARAPRAIVVCLIVLASLFALSPRPALADVQYVYDEVGRLIEVVDSTGASAQYVYDPAGNIVQIIRVAAGTVSVAGFTPKSGPVGIAVTIYGSGFDTTPSSNTVQFNGTAATVTAATASQLTTSVPTGAASGTISVTVGTQTATSAESFTVTSSAANGPPTITGFTPGGGPPGTAVTIAGTNFDTVAVNDTVTFNATQAAISSNTATQIVAAAPAYGGSGPIHVRTLYGTAQSADDFILTPPGYAYADIVARVRIAVDGAPGSLSISPTNKHGLVLFDDAGGDYLSLQLSALSVSPNGSVAYKIFDPTNAQIAAGNVSTTAMSIHLPPLARAGTYAIFFSPGAATANLTFSVARNAVLSASQPTLNANIGVAGQSIRAVFAGVAGQGTALRLSIGSTTPANQTVEFALKDPSGAVLVDTTGTPSGDGVVISIPSLAASGNYTVFVVPWNAATGTMTVALNPVMDIAADGASVNVSDAAAGYVKRLLFTGTAGQNLWFALTGLAYSPASAAATTLTVYKPDGTSLVSTSNCLTANPGGNCSGLFLANLPVSGTYSIAIQPPSNVTFSGSLTLSNELTGTLNSGTPFSLNLTRAGQVGRLSFSGTAGQGAALRLNVGATTPAGQTVEFTLIKPDGTVLVDKTGTLSGDGVVISIPSLPVTGTYQVFVGPYYEATGTMTVTLNPAMDITADGASVNVSDATAGYVKRLLFAGTAGQNLMLAFTGLTYSPGSTGATGVTIYKPDGTSLSSTGTCYASNPGGNCGSAAYLNNLPVTGTYTVVMTPPSNVTFSGSLTLSSQLTGTLVSGTPYSLNLARAGQIGRLYFSGTAAQVVTLHLGIGTTTPASQTVEFALIKPDGTVLVDKTGTAAGGGVTISNQSLPVTGTYQVFVGPYYEATGTMTVTLNP